MPRFAFGPLAPDLASILNQGGLTRAHNVVRKSGGYGPLNSLAAIAGGTALTARARGALASIDTAGNAIMFGGDETKLYRLRDTGFVDVSRASGYGALDDARWEFALIGDQVIATNYNDAPQVFNLVSSTLFADLNLNAPRARHAEIVENFLVLGNIYDLELGPLTNGISWSARGNPNSWPERGSDLAVAAQSDRNVFDGDGGWVMGIVSGSEVGAVFLEREIHRMDYRGGDLVFEFNRVEKKRGLVAPGGFAAFGREVFYIAEDGFYRFDYTRSVPIGKDKLNRFFFDDLDRNYIDRVTVVADPDQTRILIGYPGSGHSGGTPNKLLIYDYLLDDFTQASVDHEILSLVIDPGVTLDTLPDDVIDDLPYSTTSFDDRVAVPGALRIGAFNPSHLISDFTGTQLEGQIETGDLELVPGRRAFVNGARPVVLGADASVAVATLSKLGADSSEIEYGAESFQEEDGSCPLRADGRYHRFRVTLPIGFTDAVAVDVDARPSGMR